jgi:hypothetical protein
LVFVFGDILDVNPFHNLKIIRNKEIKVNVIALSSIDLSPLLPFMRDGDKVEQF